MKSKSGRRVLMLLENYPYPQDGRVRREATALAEAGYAVSVIVPIKHGQPWRETIDGVQVYRYPAPFELGGIVGYLWEYSYALIVVFIISIKVLWTTGFDVVHANCPPDVYVVIGAFYKLLGKRFVYDQHDLSPEMYDARNRGAGNPIVHKALLAFENIAYRLADQVIATNESYAAVARQRGGVSEGRLAVVRNGPELVHLRAVPADPKLTQAGKTIIGYVGVIGFQDGVDCLLRALDQLRRTLGRNDFLCVIVGDGDAVPELKSLCTSLDLNEHVWFTGWVEHDELLRYLAPVDICVAPEPSNAYTDHSTAIKIMDYMALGKPIVAFDLTEHRASAQQSALYARPNDELDFARLLAQLMDDPSQRQALGAFGYARVDKEIAWQYSIPNLLRAYERVVSNTRADRTVLPNQTISSEKH